MRALKYFFSEAAESLWRTRRAAGLSMVTIAAGLFVLGFFLLINANLERVIGHWADSAEASVYLRDDAGGDQLKAVSDLLTKSGLTSSVQFYSKDEAKREFARDFPDMASASAGLERNPFPASFNVRLNARAQESPDAVDNLAVLLSALPGVADVRYDRTWIARLNSTIRFVRGIGIAIIVLLAFASAMTVASVVRLTAMARHDEIEIMQLVGAPFAYIRGPFIVEGVLQGGLGAVVSILLLLVTFGAIRLRFGTALSDALGLTGVAFVPAQLLLLLVVGGMALGCAGGFVVARTVR